MESTSIDTGARMIKTSMARTHVQMTKLPETIDTKI